MSPYLKEEKHFWDFISKLLVFFSLLISLKLIFCCEALRVMKKFSCQSSDIQEWDCLWRVYKKNFRVLRLLLHGAGMSKVIWIITSVVIKMFASVRITFLFFVDFEWRLWWSLIYLSFIYFVERVSNRGKHICIPWMSIAPKAWIFQICYSTQRKRQKIEKIPSTQPYDKIVSVDVSIS